jgi:outer membrane lipoprotein-sorting protein
MEVLRKDDRLLAIFLSPPIQKEQKFLRNGDNMWMYLPRSKRVMRISAKERSMGGEANNSDVMRVDLVKDYEIKYLGDETLDSTLCHKLELSGKERKVAYKKIIYWISKDEALPVKRELYSISGKLMKNMYFEDVKKINGVDRPTKWIIENAIDPTYRTEFLFREIDEEVRFRNNVFTPAYLKNM